MFLLFLLPGSLLTAQNQSELFSILKQRDSLLFNLGFNRCDIAVFDSLLCDSFEFYHDEAGITDSKAAFIAGIRDGLCKLPYKPERLPDDSSFQVFPMRKNGVLYGAIQTGTHRFYAIERGKPKTLTSTARFTNLWLLENGRWRLSRSLSYDHRKK